MQPSEWAAKPPLRPNHVWSLRTELQIEGRTRDLAMFNLAIDRKLRGCDAVAKRTRPARPPTAAGATKATLGWFPSDLSVGDRTNLGVSVFVQPEAQRKAAAFNRWHEPDDARVSSPDL